MTRRDDEEARRAREQFMGAVPAAVPCAVVPRAVAEGPRARPPGAGRRARGRAFSKLRRDWDPDDKFLAGENLFLTTIVGPRQVSLPAAE